MATLTIRNLEEDLVERIRRRANANARSTEAEVRQLLRQEYTPVDRSAWIEEVRRIRAMSPPITSPPFSEDLIREDRDSR